VSSFFAQKCNKTGAKLHDLAEMPLQAAKLFEILVILGKIN
jgi:hypothetical protein